MADQSRRRASSAAPRSQRQTFLPGSGVGEPRQPASAASETVAETETFAEMLSGKTVYVVDCHSLIYQVFHALPEMSSPSGQPVGAVFGFARDIFYLLNQKRPDYLFCAFDRPEKTFRHELYQPYKIQRESMPEDLRPQITEIRRLLMAMGIPVLDHPSYEADDILATVARHTEQLGGECFLVTGDKDCRQLITDRVWVYNVRKDEIYDAAALRETWGIRPDQVVDFQSLVGDSVDNVPGVSLIGPKIARELLNKYDTLEGVLDHAGEVSGTRRKQNLIEGREVALLSRKLVRLIDRVPVDVDWTAGRVGGINQERVLPLLREFGFRRLTEELGGWDANEAPSAWEADYRAITTPAELERLVAQMSEQDQISLDTETTDLNPRRAEIVGYCFAWEAGRAYYVPVSAPQGEPCLDPKSTLDSLRPVLENPSIKKIGQNLKYDMVVLRGAGVELAGETFDTMVADYLLEAGARTHNMDDLSKRYLNHTPIKISALIGKGKQQKRMDEVPLESITQYAAEDADVPLRLVDILRQKLKEQQLDRLFTTLEMPLIEVLVELEYNGIKVDVDHLRQLSRRFGERIDALEHEIYDLAGHTFNIASPKQLATVLFKEQMLPVLKKTKTGASTDAEVLEQLANQHPLPAKIIEYRQNAKLKSTYVDSLPQLVHPTTGRVHTSFNQVVAATGRLSSNDPNLQNIPIRTEAGREIRSAFLPGHEGWQLLAADYSQIELRVLAHFSRDETLLAAFAKDEDIHAHVASEVHGVPLEGVTSEMRQRAKAINFGMIYGQSPFGLAKMLDIEHEEATQFIDAYFTRHPGVDRLLTKILEECRQNGYVTTILGRRRSIQGIRPISDVAGVSRHRILPERTAINTVIQGSAADLIKLAMIRVHDRLRREKHPARMLLQIHDELVFEVPLEQVANLAELVTEEMAGVQELAVPLKVDVKSGSNWAQC